MKRSNLGAVHNWTPVEGPKGFPLADRGPRRISFGIVTAGANVYVREADARTLVLSGSGHHSLEFGIATHAVVEVEPWKGCHEYAVQLDGRPVPEVGWHGGGSFTSLEPKSQTAVSAEVQAMFDTMHRNMLAREAALRAEIERSKAR